VLVRYKHEVKGELDFRASGVLPEDCGKHDHDQDGNHEEDNSDHG
jgi:hypothetical protein